MKSLEPKWESLGVAILINLWFCVTSEMGLGLIPAPKGVCPHLKRKTLHILWQLALSGEKIFGTQMAVSSAG